MPSEMFTWPMTISTVTGEGAREVEALVDTGATHSMAPASLLEEIGIEPTTHVTMRLADGTRSVWALGEMRVVVSGNRAVALIVFGPEDAMPLLGATTLEGAHLAVDPLERRLVPADGLLLKQA